MGRRVAAVCLCLILLAGAGCSGGSGKVAGFGDAPQEPAGPSPLLDGFDVHEGDGFSIQLPETWTVLPIEGGDVADLVEQEMEGLGPEGFGEDVAAAVEQGGRLFALDVNGAQSGFADNIGILELPRPAAPIEAIESANLAQFAAIGATGVSSEIRSLPAGDAVLIHYSWDGNQGIGAIVLAGSAQWVITLGATDTDRLAATFDAILETFRVESG